MTRTVFCRKYQQELEGLEAPPLPGKRGQDVYEHVSKRAWQEWQAHQTRLINEKHLNLMEPAARAYLTEQMERFLDNRDVDAAEGYVAPDGSA
jgi:Fe-S cluster biosynthesis and repair protein YggX